MSKFKVPIKEIQFTLNALCNMDELSQIPAFESASPDTINDIFNEAEKFITDFLVPISADAEKDGSLIKYSNVITPKGFKEAYQQFTQGGWSGLSVESEYNGYGLPQVIGAAFSEMLSYGSIGFSLCPTLTTGAIEGIKLHATPFLKETFLPKLVSGEWAGTMNLTESQAGSNVGALRTKAEPLGDGTYKIKGQKIYITYGDHDLTENIIHLILARLPDAPAGTKGISMFLVPKFLVNPDGSLGKHNDVHCISLEHKLGIHSSPTCVMMYGDNEGAIGYLVGKENQGMANMFTTMNNARLHVGLQGVGVSERAYQHALDYALTRKQGSRKSDNEFKNVYIFEHPDVKRMLLSMKAQTESSRAVCYMTAWYLDQRLVAPTKEERHKADMRAHLLTPVAKAYASDISCDISSLGIQVHGGMGFIEETGAAQYYRDARITPIYEGTNGIQAIDLVIRKLPMSDGAIVLDYIAELNTTTHALKKLNQDKSFALICTHLESGIHALSQSTEWLLEQLKLKETDNALAGATTYLRQFGLVAGGTYLARSALLAHDKLRQGSEDHDFLNARITTAGFFAQQFLSQAPAMISAITGRADILNTIKAQGMTPS